MSITATVTLYLFSGNAASILKEQGISPATRVVPFSEKQLMSIGNTLSLLRSDSSEYLIFGAYSLDLQRYFGIIAVLLLLSGRFSGAFADEKGRIVRIRPLRTVFVVIPSLCFEALSGLFMVISSYFRLFRGMR